MTTAAPSAEGVASALDSKICEPGGRGIAFPLTQAEQHWHPGLRAVLYLAALCYLFLGVSIVADKFMVSIEMITSRKRRVRLRGTDRVVTTKVWNETVANLTLMALGSSAPEILLSIVEIMMNGFHSGEFGPSTIVGSAAFNLFVIIAVCMVAIPSAETRKIKATAVFFVTAVFSLFAYFWLVFIVMVTSPNVVEVWEGVLTLFLFPLLCFVSYLADIGYFDGQPESYSRSQMAAELEGTASYNSSSLQSLQSHVMNYGSQQYYQPSWPGHVGGGVGPYQAAVAHAVAPVAGMNGHRALPYADMVLDEKGRPIVSAAGVLTFQSDTMDVLGGIQARKIMVPVYRRNGTAGAVSCKYHMESLTAIPGYDYEDGRGQLYFGPGMSVQEVPVTVLTKRLGEHSDRFQIVLDEVEGGAIFNPNNDGGKDQSLLTITILNESDALTRHSLGLQANRFLDGVVNMDAARAANATWYDDISDAIFLGPQEDGEPPTSFDWVMHLISVPWKLMFSMFIPPAGHCGGWVCFVLALVWIGVMTAVIIDFAELFGCVANVENSITAISFVALGTSMPDLFASKTSALQDDTADASIVNVTGSNSVNVFLGIGLPWTMAALYWQNVGATSDWQSKYSNYVEAYPMGAFIVEGGDLAFSVIVFSIGAVIALVTLRVRRVKLGGELGGPSAIKWLSFVLFVTLWVFYLALSTWKVKAKDVGLGIQVFAVFLAFVVLENVVLGAGLALAAFMSKGESPTGKAGRDCDSEDAASSAARTASSRGASGGGVVGEPHDDILRRVAGGGDPFHMQADASSFGTVPSDAGSFFESGASLTSTAMVALAATRLKRAIKARKTEVAQGRRPNQCGQPWPTMLGAGSSDQPVLGQPPTMPLAASQNQPLVGFAHMQHHSLAQQHQQQLLLQQQLLHQQWQQQQLVQQQPQQHRPQVRQHQQQLQQLQHQQRQHQPLRPGEQAFPLGGRGPAQQPPQNPARGLRAPHLQFQDSGLPQQQQHHQQQQQHHQYQHSHGFGLGAESFGSSSAAGLQQHERWRSVDDGGYRAQPPLLRPSGRAAEEEAPLTRVPSFHSLPE